jgi:hypothetical protein
MNVMQVFPTNEQLINQITEQPSSGESDNSVFFGTVNLTLRAAQKAERMCFLLDTNTQIEHYKLSLTHYNKLIELFAAVISHRRSLEIQAAKSQPSKLDTFVE